MLVKARLKNQFGQTGCSRISNGVLPQTRKGNCSNTQLEVGKMVVSDVWAAFADLVSGTGHPEAQPCELSMHARGSAAGLELCSLAIGAWWLSDRTGLCAEADP